MVDFQDMDSLECQGWKPMRWFSMFLLIRLVHICLQDTAQKIKSFYNRRLGTPNSLPEVSPVSPPFRDKHLKPELEELPEVPVYTEHRTNLPVVERGQEVLLTLLHTVQDRHMEPEVTAAMWE